MTWFPIALTIPQYVDSNGDPYSGAVLKAYTAGTTTNISMATDYTGGTTATDFVLNSAGYPVSGGSPIIPHVQENCKLALYPTQAAADADSGAVWTYDNIQVATNTNADRIIAHAEDTGTADAYVMAPSPAISAYTEGQIATLQPGNTNTSASTLTISGLDAKTIKTPGGADLSANMLLSGGEYVLIYDGTYWVLTNPSLTSGGSLVHIKTITASNDATVDFVNGSGGVVLDSTYKSYLIKLIGVVPATDDTDLYLRTDSNTGASFDAGTSDYSWAVEGLSGDASSFDTQDNADAQIKLHGVTGIGSDTGEGVNAEINMYDPAGTTLYKSFSWVIGGQIISGDAFYVTGAGAREAVAAIDAIRFLFSSGNIESGVFILYGVTNS